MRRVACAATLTLVAGLVAPAVLARTPQDPARTSPATVTCDPAAIAPASYRLTAEAQALNITTPRHRWWDNYDIGKHPKDVRDVNDAAIAIAERALQLDDRNLLAHAQLARQYVVDGIDARKAREEWNRTLDAGGAIVWTATLYEVDPRSYFVVAFDRAGIRIYRFGQLAGALKTTFGVPEFPGPDREELWRALGGCVPDTIAPEATIAWDDVRELESGEFVLAFELDRRVEITSDRRNRKSLSTVVVSLHGVAGDFDHRYAIYRGPGTIRFGRATVGPAAYQERVRGMLVEFFDPQGRIKLPKQRRAW